MKRVARTLTETTLLVTGALFVIFRVLAAALESSFFRTLSKLALSCLVLVVLIWAFRIIWRRFFWRVGRRLAFSYFVVGVLPLCLFALLFLLTGYLLGGFLLGHLYRDAVGELAEEMITAAETRLADPAQRRRALSGMSREIGALAFAEYRDGRKIAGDAEAPGTWPAWLESNGSRRNRLAARALGDAPAAAAPLFVARADGTVTAAAAARTGNRGVLVYAEGDLAADLRHRTRVWLELLRDDDPRRKATTRLSILGREIRLGGGLQLSSTPEQSAEYYRLNPPRAGDVATVWERPVILWMESSGELPRLADGAAVASDIAASMAASPTTLFRALLSASAEVDSAAWIALAGVAVLFAEIYFVAAGIAIFMIFGLSRAVNRLSRATDAIASGDFSTRIPVRRKDQLGDLQRSFNAMSEHLEELVQTAAQKEALDKELALARQVQEDLLPAAIGDHAGVAFATHFEPSAAIGGDYYDILDDGRGRLAVMIADVAGHGLAAGLRMALVKAGVTLQIEDEIAAPEIFARLHRLLRKKSGERSFVTASLTLFDPATGELELTNAGHPPSYVVRDNGEVDELLAPGMPLGVMAGAPGRLATRLVPGDIVVWLSDGLIEGADLAGRQFGFDGVRKALAGPARTAAEVRDRLLAGVRIHTGGRPAEDDRTLVVMRYEATTTGGEASADSGSSPR